jgi:hypothetical protein
LPLDEEERALMIFQSIATTSGGKTKIAYQLGPILTKKYSPERIAELEPSATPDEIDARRQAEALAARAAQQAFRAKLPKYIVNGLEYATGVPVDSGEAPFVEAAAAHA